MDQNTLQLLGAVKVKNNITNEFKILEVTGFDILGFFFPFIRYAIDGIWSKAILTFFVCFTVIGYPIMAWYTGFNFRKIRLETYLKSGWTLEK